MNVSHERLLSVLRYDPDSGIFTWLQQTSVRVNVGDVAGNTSKEGYRRIFIDGDSYQAHRLAFFYMTKRWPSRFIDHINAVRDDNRWINIREATDALNSENQRRAKSNSVTGFLGVTPIRNIFIARIRVSGKTYHIGTFKTPELAHEAYIKAKRQLHKGCAI